MQLPVLADLARSAEDYAVAAKKLTVVVSEDRIDHSVGRKMQQALVAGLRDKPGLDLVLMPHLYDLAPDGPAMQFLRRVHGDLVVLGWLYPRAAFWMLRANRVRGLMGHTSFFPDEELEALPPLPTGKSRLRDDREPADRRIWCIDLREHAEADPVLDEVERIQCTVRGLTLPDDAWGIAANGTTRIEEAVRPRWYPVIDYDRCGNCQQCKQFCPFEVFDLDENGTLLVAQPDDCVGGCMACARICESGAILISQDEQLAIAGDARAPRKGMKSNPAELHRAAGVDEAARAERERAVATSTSSRSGKLHGKR